MKFIIGGDLVPTYDNKSYFVEGNIEKIIDKNILKIISEYDYKIFNLEVPLTNEISPIVKAGPNLSCSTDVIKGLKIINNDFFTLANNHIYDQGEQGIKSTIDVLNDNHISYAGVGGLNNTHKCHFFEKKGVKIGVYCCCEHEFSIVNNKHIGANPFDPLESLDHIRNAKKECDHLIVLYHGGKEHYRYPSPNLQKTCRKIVECGASLVVCQHSHCVGCKEEYLNGTIVYGQGNFLFNLKDNEFWNTSLLLDIEASKEKLDINYIPLQRKGLGVEISTNSTIIDDFLKRSEEIKTEGFISDKYLKFADLQICDLLINILDKKNIFFKVINKITKGNYKRNWINKYLKKNEVRLLNYFECEAYRELITYYLKNK